MNQAKLSSLVQLGSTPITLIAFLILISPNFGLQISEYQFAWPVLWSVLIGIVSAIALSIILSAFFGRELENAVNDERDDHINKKGDYYTQGFYIGGGVLALVLAVLEQEHFWIALAIFVSFNLASLSASVAKLIMYRFGVS